MLQEGLPESMRVKHELVIRFNKHWSLDRIDLATMYGDCFQSDTSGALWGGSKFSARESMIYLLEHDPHFGRSIFRDLFNEERDIALRLVRCREHIAGFFKDLNRSEAGWMDPRHDDRQITLYLALAFPQHYTLFDYEHFLHSMLQLGMNKAPEPHEVVRFFKLSQTLFKMASQEVSLLQTYAEQIEGFVPSTMMVNDFYEYLQASKDS